MMPDRPQASLGLRILKGFARVVAAAVLAVVASAALAGLDVAPLEFQRVLPVVLTGEAILYILMLGGGSVAGPVLLLTVGLTFVLRAGIAVCAALLAPQEGGDLIAGAKFYYASYWPAATAQVLLMTVLLRLLRPLLARRRSSRRRRRAATPRPEDVVDEATREAILAALAQSPDEPPVSPTVLEEQQIGDLAERVEIEDKEKPPPQELALPLDEDEEPEIETEEQVETAATEEPSLPPGVVDVTAGAPTSAVAADGTEASQDAAPEVVASTPAPASVEAEEPQPVDAAPGESTDRFEPVSAPEAEKPPLVAPPRNLQEMVEVISHAAGGGAAEVRVWGTSDGRTVIAAVPAGTPAASTAAHAEGVVRAHLDLCTWLGVEATCVQITATRLGAYALRALDDAAAVLLLLAGRGPAAGRLELTMARTGEAVQGMVTVDAPPSPPRAPEMVPLREDTSIAEVIADAARAVGGRLIRGWRGYRREDGNAVLVAAPTGVDTEALGRIAVAAAEDVASFTDALALDGPTLLTLNGGSVLLALGWHRIGERDALLVAVSDDSGGVGRVGWELGEIARRAGGDR